MTREKLQETADSPDSCINDGMDVNSWERTGHSFPKFGGEFETQLRGIFFVSGQVPGFDRSLVQCISASHAFCHAYGINFGAMRVLAGMFDMNGGILEIPEVTMNPDEVIALPRALVTRLSMFDEQDIEDMAMRWRNLVLAEFASIEDDGERYSYYSCSFREGVAEHLAPELFSDALGDLVLICAEATGKQKVYFTVAR
jgi:hypothetical protein